MRVQPPKDYKKWPKTFETPESIKKYLLAHRVVFADREEMNIVDFYKEFVDGKNDFYGMIQFLDLFPLEYQGHVRRIFQDLV